MNMQVVYDFSDAQMEQLRALHQKINQAGIAMGRQPQTLQTTFCNMMLTGSTHDITAKMQATEKMANSTLNIYATPEQQKVLDHIYDSFVDADIFHYTLQPNGHITITETTDSLTFWYSVEADLVMDDAHFTLPPLIPAPTAQHCDEIEPDLER